MARKAQVLVGCFTCFDFPNWYGSFLRLSRLTYNETTETIDPASELIMINVRQFNGTHRGGGLVFDNDGFLCLTIGDQARHAGSQNIVNNFEGGCQLYFINSIEPVDCRIDDLHYGCLGSSVSKTELTGGRNCQAVFL